ncbi:NlpC/P60 family protein [Nocardioides sp.]|uniref:C40 family peptidase n=1 Tax=Nocardioides sp. TaxID=35761 RepID=UPI0035149D1D
MRLASAGAGLALAAVLGLTTMPAQAEPDIDSVRDRVETLFHEAEQASERLNDAKLELDRLQEGLEDLQADERRASRQLDDVRAEARDAVLTQFTGGGYDALTSVLTAGDTGALVEQMGAMSSLQELQQGVLDDYRAGAKALDLRRQATETRVDQLTDLRAQLAREKATVEEKLASAEDLLADLEEKQREALLAGDTSAIPKNIPASGRAKAAIDFAMAQVGDSYVYGAAGPSAWDCSGLTMVAWAQAGVALPHSSAAQYGSGPHVAASDLQPGDLVFYYSPISHVGMYIGNGMIVHAANPGAGVRVSPLYSMPYVGAVRPG